MENSHVSDLRNLPQEHPHVCGGYSHRQRRRWFARNGRCLRIFRSALAFGHHVLLDVRHRLRRRAHFQQHSAGRCEREQHRDRNASRSPGWRWSHRHFRSDSRYERLGHQLVEHIYRVGSIGHDHGRFDYTRLGCIDFSLVVWDNFCHGAVQSRTSRAVSCGSSRSD